MGDSEAKNDDFRNSLESEGEVETPEQEQVYAKSNIVKGNIYHMRMYYIE